jgi:hypothetical protein
VQTNGEPFSISKTDIESRKELATSIMPVGLLDKLTANEIQNLMSYLLEDKNLVGERPKDINSP